MSTRNVVLTERHDLLIQHLVRCGRYQNASAVVREGLRMIEARESDYELKFKALKDAIAVGIAAADAGDVESFDDFDQLDAHLTKVADNVRSR